MYYIYIYKPVATPAPLFEFTFSESASEREETKPAPPTPTLLTYIASIYTIHGSARPWYLYNLSRRLALSVSTKVCKKKAPPSVVWTVECLCMCVHVVTGDKPKKREASSSSRKKA